MNLPLVSIAYDNLIGLIAKGLHIFSDVSVDALNMSEIALPTTKPNINLCHNISM